MSQLIKYFAEESLYNQIRGTLKDSNSGLETILDYKNVFELIAALIQFGFSVAGIIAVAFVVYGGIMYILAAGQPDKTKSATQIITNAIIGMVIALAALAIIYTIKNALQAGNIGVTS